MLAACKLEFEAFIALIEAVLNPTQVRELRALLLWAAPSSWHTCVSVFQEHPSMLSDDDRARWRKVTDADAKALAAALRERYVAGAAPARPRHAHRVRRRRADRWLSRNQLFGAVWRPDRLAPRWARRCSASSPRGRSGSSTSRWAGWRAGVAQRCTAGGGRERRATFNARRRRPAVAATPITLPEVSLARDDVWFMTEYTELARLPLGVPAEESRKRERRGAGPCKKMAFVAAVLVGGLPRSPRCAPPRTAARSTACPSARSRSEAGSHRRRCRAPPSCCTSARLPPRSRHCRASSIDGGAPAAPPRRRAAERVALVERRRPHDAVV